ncbi:hypothetical protein Ahy_B03g067871 [Arachis hypogaea]|uniref:SWIM-type domain-containing protein n=1 Tax=Arachis hypogaea TaxID=3818 RepID=A0A445A7Y2_ARAHY|nr:hypothetical protein Ahy_B03g067871 [Arachis hypogaea]
MWRFAKATHWKEWEKEMQIIRTINVDAHKHLNAIPPRFWSRSRFNFHSKCDTLVNNMCESFNGAIVESREKPIVTMLEDIRVYLMIRWAVNRERIKNFNGTLLPRIRMKLERRGRSAGEWRPYWSAAQTYEVVNGLNKFAVDFSAHECSCRKWQLSGIPCTHAISCINFKGLDIDAFVDDCYKKAAYVKCYDSVINPLNGQDLWEITKFDDVMPLPTESLATDQLRRGREDQMKPGTAASPTCLGEDKSSDDQNLSQPARKRTRGGRKASSSRPMTSSKASSQPVMQSESGATTTSKPNSTQSGSRPTSSSTRPKTKSTRSKTQQPPALKEMGAASSSQADRTVSFSHKFPLHVSPRKLSLMAKFPPRLWEKL